MACLRRSAWVMPGRCVFAVAVVCFLSLIAVAEPDPAAASPPSKQTPYELWLDEQTIAARVYAERAKQAIGQVDRAVQDVGDAGQGMVDLLRPLGDPESRLKQIEVLRHGFQSANATDADRAALDHLIAGRYEDAVQTFDASWQADRARGLPALFKGIAQLELGRWADALESLPVAERHAGCLPTATLLRAWAGRCVQAPPANDAEAGLRFLQALADLPPLEIGMENAVARRMVYNESDALYWAQGAAYNLRYKDIKALRAESQTTEDPDRATTLTFAFGQPASLDATLIQLGRRFPDHAPTQRHLSMLHIQNLSDEDLRAAWPEVQRLIDEAQGQDPGNGYYDLMRVLPINDFEAVELDDGTVDYIDVAEPYTDAEIAALRRAADAPRFEHPGDTIRRRAYAAWDRQLGVFAEMRGNSLLGLRMLDFRNVLGRYPNSYKAMVQAGRGDEAAELASTLRRLAQRALPEWEPNPTMDLLSIGACDFYPQQAWMEHAARTGDAELMRASVELMVRQNRRNDFGRSLLDPVMLANVLPVRRIRTAVTQLAQHGKSADSPLCVQVHLWYLNQNRERIDHWMEQLEEDLNDGDGKIRDDYALIRLAVLGHRPALPLISRYLESDDLYSAELARWAAGQFNRLEVHPD